MSLEEVPTTPIKAHDPIRAHAIQLAVMGAEMRRHINLGTPDPIAATMVAAAEVLARKKLLEQTPLGRALLEAVNRADNGDYAPQ